MADLPADIEQSAADWLGRAPTPAERKHLLTMLGTYGADWLCDGIAAAVAQGGQSLGYLRAMLEGCRASGRPPGSPKSSANGERYGQNLARRPAAARAGEADLADLAREAQRRILGHD